VDASSVASLTSIDRHSVTAFIAAALSAIPPAALVRNVAPAGIPIRLTSNTDALFAPYVARLVGQPVTAPMVRIAANVMPNLPAWTDEACSPQCFHEVLAAHGLKAAYPFRPGLWQVLDTRTGIGALLVDDAARLPPWDAGAPLRQHLHWLLSMHGKRVMHASSLGDADKGLLFVGNAGAGKSGMALAGLSVGLSTVGDDYLSIGNEAGAVVARPLYRIIKQDRYGLARVPQLAAHAEHLPLNWKGKAELDPEHYFAGAFIDRLEIKAVAIPRIARATEPSFAEVGKGEALRALMRSNLHQYPGEKDDGMAFYGDVLRRLPVFRIDLSENFPANGELARRLLQSL
jgi:hypothetical protein